MKSKEIHNRLKDKEINYSMLAEALDVSPAHVRNVAEKIFISRRVATAIAAAIDCSFDEVFPEYATKTAKGKKNKRKKTISALKKKIAQNA